MAKIFPLLLAALAGSAIASPAPVPTQAPDLDKRATTCTFTGSNGAAQASASQKSCATIILSNVAVPTGVTLDLGSLNANTHVIFKGTTTWGYKEWAGPLLRIAGTSVTVDGASATLDAGGARWWDGKGTDGKVKPKFFYAHDLTTSTINDLHILNTPLMAVSISDVSGLAINNMIIDNSAGDSAGGHNTDGFDIGDSSSVTITGAKVYNQDDCVAVNSGSDITFTGGLCSGGHGLSIGSVGNRDNNKVSNVKFLNSQVKNSVQAIRIKTVAGATGSVSGVTYSGITMSGITGYGIIIEQNYNGGDLKGDPTSGVPITGLTISDITGTGGVSSSGYNIVIVCGTSGCSNWTWSKVAVTGGKKYGSCKAIPSPATC
ncbi:hypothetical protein G7Z17_g1921 [Cylindrodendrum hubeiense]|uniref:endo-polygalacturonase n=1 Tax=Cylindrodendrum hubeiense TaxID=595255 RepID=A0A9P5LJM8_9HYPO|nr:hypothetical protein G7Z17_g1921 [Cylindrodendrum hubeiense]